MKICIGCQQELDESQFNKDSTCPDGIKSRCKKCSYERNKINKKLLREKKRLERLNWTPDPSIYKVCQSCGESKSQTEYYYNPDYADCCHIRCKKCESSKISILSKIKRKHLIEQKEKGFQEYLNRGIKQCVSCHQDLPFSEFHLNNRCKDKLNSYCKTCALNISSTSHKRAYQNNPDKFKAIVREYYHENKELISEKTREDRQLNPDKYRVIDRKHYLRRMGAIRKASVDPFFNLEAHESYLKEWQRGRCFYCLKELSPVRGEVHIEHIVPITRGGLHTASNIVLACPQCNLPKLNKLYGVEWVPPIIHRVPDDEIFISPDEIKCRLEGQASWELIPHNNSLIIQGTKTVQLFVLSSFLASERNPYSFRKAVTLKKEFPDAIVLFDYELRDRFPNVVNMLTAKAGIASRFPARKLTVEVIDPSEARTFLDQRHLMGFGSGTIHIGLRDTSGTLYGVGVFFRKGDLFENTRLAFSGHVPGGMSKILNFLWKTEGNIPVMSFVDSRYADGSGHETVGFKYLGMTAPNFRWIFPDKNQHYRYLSNLNKVSRNLAWYDDSLGIKENISINGVAKLYVPPLHKIILERV